jgi:integrase
VIGKRHQPVRAALDGERVLELTVDRLNNYIAQRRAMHAAPGTITQEMIFLRAALRLAHRHQRIAHLLYVPTAREGGVRKGFVDVKLFDRIHAAMPDLYRDMAEFLFLSGWRYEEVCGLELAWVFLAARGRRRKRGDDDLRPPVAAVFKTVRHHQP